MIAGGKLKVALTLADKSTFPHLGVVNFVDQALQNTTGTLLLRATVPNPEHVLLPGQFVRVRPVGITRDSAVLVPQRAVQQGLAGSFVYLLGPNNTAMARDVSATSWEGGRWLIRSGTQGRRSGDRRRRAQGRPGSPGESLAVRCVQGFHAASVGGHGGKHEGGTMSAAGSDPLDQPRAKKEVDQEAEGIRNLFIRRPIFAAVISIVITLLGLFALTMLPIARYPQITPPAVQVSANYPGATAHDVAHAVAAPIEQQLAGLHGLLYYKSSNSSDGTMNLQVSFDISRDQDLAAVDVQNADHARRAAAARRRCGERRHRSQGATRHPARRRAHVRRPALRRDVSSATTRSSISRTSSSASPASATRRRFGTRTSRCCSSSTPRRWRSSASR